MDENDVGDFAIFVPFALSSGILLLLSSQLARLVGAVMLRRLALANLVVTSLAVAALGVLLWAGAQGGGSVDPSQSARVGTPAPFPTAQVAVLACVQVLAVAAWLKRRRGAS